MMKKLSSRERKIAVVCLVMVVAYGIFQIFIRPGKKRDQGLLKSIAASRQVLDKNNRILNDTYAIEQKTKTYLKMFGQKGSDEQETSVLISDMETVAGKFNIQITNMQPQKALIKDGYKLMGIQIVVSGTLLTITQFVHELQDSPYFIDVSEVQLEKSMGPESIVRGRLTLIKIRLRSSN